MQNPFDRAYYESRLMRCRELAARATTPSIREVHLHHAKHYEHILELTSVVPGQRTTPRLHVAGCSQSI